MRFNPKMALLCLGAAVILLPLVSMLFMPLLLLAFLGGAWFLMPAGEMRWIAEGFFQLYRMLRYKNARSVFVLGCATMRLMYIRGLIPRAVASGKNGFFIADVADASMVYGAAQEALLLLKNKGADAFIFPESPQMTGMTRAALAVVLMIAALFAGSLWNVFSFAGICLVAYMGGSYLSPVFQKLLYTPAVCGVKINSARPSRRSLRLFGGRYVRQETGIEVSVSVGRIIEVEIVD